jgi:hypothetical protein
MRKVGQMSGRLDVYFPLDGNFLVQYINIPYITTTDLRSHHNDFFYENA